MLEIGQSVHGMPSCEATGLDAVQMQTISRIMRSPYIDTADYKLRSACGAFLQGYDESNGWILIEFWQRPDRAQQEFVDHLNAQVFGASRPSAVGEEG